MKSRSKSVRLSAIKAVMLGGASISMLALSQVAVAQQDDDEVVVLGTRAVIQDALSLKRDAIGVVDGLSADEIGELPGLSIAEALETITAVGSQREGSGATEVSIRGLGPFLGSTIVNGREATNGSGDRSVNFGQFPSELFNKLEVFKTQEASFIEGGVAGQISLSTLKPLEYGKRRIQFQAKGNIQPDNLNIDHPEQTDVGYRLTGSYVDQWESNTLGEFGLSIGGQIQRRPNAEQEARSSSTFDGCRIALLDGNSCDDFEDFRQFIDDELEDEGDLVGFPGLEDDDLDNFTDQELVDLFRDTRSEEFSGDEDDPSQDVTFGEAFINDADVQDARVINPFTGQPFGATEPVVFTSGERSFRQNVTNDERDSIFAATQWRPNDRFEFNADLQYSDRTFSEVRNDFAFEANDIEEFGSSDVIEGFELVTASDGSLRRATTTGSAQARLQTSVRSEEYLGFGGNIAFEVTDRLRLSVDGSYSDTTRSEEQLRVRFATPSIRTGIEVLQNGGQAQQFTVVDTNVLDPTLFTDDALEIQEDLNQFRNNTIQAIRGDVEYDLDNGFFTTFKAGGRFSRLEYDQLPRVRNEFEIDDNSDFLDGEFVSSLNGVDVVSTIELDVGTGDERDLANALGLGDLVGFGTIGGGNDLNNDNFEGLTGVVPGSTATFVIDSNGDFDITTTAEEFVRLGFADDGDTDTPNEGFSNLGALAAAECANDTFPESNFLDGEVNGNLITNIDSDGNPIAAGTGNEFLTFTDISCLANAVIGRDLVAPTAADASGAELVQSVDINEDTFALYGQFDYETVFEGIPIRGNFGVRYIDTSLTSNSFRTNITVELDDEGNVTGLDSSNGTNDVIAVQDEFDYSEFLPSFNFVADINEDLVFRGGIFRALSRPDPSDLGNGRTFNILNLTDAEDNVSISDFIGGVQANGNPNLEPFTSWNYDLAAEWYPDADSILGVGAYYKVFTGGFQNSIQTETFNINGQDLLVEVPVLTTSNETNTIFGVELNAAHAFTYLPGYLSGFGFKASYNYADSNFEFEDSQFGEAVTLGENGDIIAVRNGFIDPANLPGLSTHTANGQIYYNIGNATFTGIGKFRSSFFQQFISTPGFLRFIDDAFVADARISYKVNNNIKLSLEGTNLLNTAREQFNPTLDSFAEINVFGPRFFAGITAKF